MPLLGELFDIKAFLEEHNIRYRVVRSSNAHRGNELNFDCPFCQRQNISYKSQKFFLNEKTGAGFCYRARCSWSGNFIQFVGEYLDIPIDTVEDLYKKDSDSFNIHVRMPDHIESFATEDKKVKISIPDCSEVLLEDDYPEYLTGRGLDFAKASDLSCRICYECIYTEPIKSCRKKQDGIIKPRYENRIFVPITTLDEHTFQAITFLDGDPKTENPPGSFKNRMLFGYNRLLTLEHIDYVLVTEGIFDAVRMWDYDYHNTVAILGSKISEYQAYLLSALAPEEIILMLDSDVKENDLEKNKSVILDFFGGALSVIQLESGDPNDIVDLDVMNELFRNKQIITTFKIGLNLDL